MSEAGLFINTYNFNKEKTLLILHCTIVVVGIVFNFTMLVLVLLINKLRSVQGIRYVINLSCANLIFHTLVLCCGIYPDALKIKALCNVLSAATTFSCIASSFSRGMVAMDRYVYISDPLHYYYRSLEPRIVRRTLFLWLTAACLTMTSYIVNFIFTNDTTDIYCVPIPREIYNVVILIVGVIMPMLYEVFVYTRIFYWACLHIQIMRQEACYTIQLRQRHVKEAYNVDLKQLELFTRASFLLTSVLSRKAKEEETIIPQATETEEVEDQSNSIIATLRRLSGSTPVASYIGSLLKFSVSTKSTTTTHTDDFLDSTDSRSKRDSFPSRRANDSGTALDLYRDCSQIDKSMTSTYGKSMNEFQRPEDAFIDQELLRLSKTVEGSSVCSQSLNTAINNLLLRTEIKAGLILLLILGSAVGCWIPFFIFTISEISNINNPLIIQRKVANLFVYTLSCLDPIVYDLLHQPIRTTIKEELRQSLVGREFM